MKPLSEHLGPAQHPEADAPFQPKRRMNYRMPNTNPPSEEREKSAPASASAPGELRALYFGCARGVWHQDVGHGFHEPGGRSLGLGRRGQDIGPWGLKVDSRLQPLAAGGTKEQRPYGEEAPQGRALLHHKDGWTALAFWDRTGDSRSNSNSTFLFDTTLSFDEALVAAKENFPELFERFDFEVSQVS